MSRRARSSATQYRLKRALDVLLAGGALLVLAPVLALVALAVRLDSPGPALFTSERIGQGFRRFRLYKFRTMVVGADGQRKALAGRNLYAQPRLVPIGGCPECARRREPCSPLLIGDAGLVVCEREREASRAAEQAAPFFKVKADPRVTRLGRFLRNTSLDELPQLWNIVRGDMSLVGNRPLPTDEAERLTSDEAVARYLAPAGLTGLWQVEQRGRAEVGPAERIALDNRYAAEHSLLGDLRLLVRTVPAVIQRDSV